MSVAFSFLKKNIAMDVLAFCAIIVHILNMRDNYAD